MNIISSYLKHEIGRNDGLNTLCQNCGFDYQQRVLKTFPGHGHIRSKEGVVLLAFTGEFLYIWLIIPFSCGSIPLILVLI